MLCHTLVSDVSSGMVFHMVLSFLPQDCEDFCCTNLSLTHGWTFVLLYIML